MSVWCLDSGRCRGSEKARRVGINAFIQKPDNLHNLVATVRSLLDEVRAREKKLKKGEAEQEEFYGEEEAKLKERTDTEDDGDE